MPSADDIQQIVQKYVELVAAHQPEAVADLFAADATIEDPVGSELKTDRAAFVEFYSVIAGMEETTSELLWSRVAGDTAVFEFRLRVATAGHGYEVQPVDIMTFGEDGKIATMRAVWNPATDIKIL
ncbi:nuclear transport factor 2 family protein [Mycolicibacterium fluoranthenivorans]|uniref:Steroid delta-isomerase n=1 Tax=Mycolicibacterium fluoranthenivorans TaxID=258505 RepID=A0A1G4VIJ3_9MYCO|nr:steroid delta-isomerase [Mycolicibacterium fluoranthenivorans]